MKQQEATAVKEIIINQYSSTTNSNTVASVYGNKDEDINVHAC